MKTRRDGTATVMILTLILISCVLATAAQARLVRSPNRPPGVPAYQGNELIFEGGLVEPLQDLKADFWTTDTGMGASTGYELGVRYRYYLGPNLAVTPAFHYLRFGSMSGIGDFSQGENLGYDIRVSQYRYGLDLQVFVGSPTVAARPYLTGGVAYAHNIYRDELQYFGIYEESVDSPAFNAGAGLKMGILEIKGSYHFNRFSTTKILAGPESVDFNWDYASFTVGFAFGRH